MKTFAHIVACHDDDILPFSVQQLKRQVDHIVVALGQCWWLGFDGPVGNVTGDEPYLQDPGKISVIKGHWDTQEEHRNACLREIESRWIVEEGDLLILVDADELWRDERLKAIIDVFRTTPELPSLAACCAEFWSYDRIRHGGIGGRYVPRMRFWRYTKGCEFTNGNTLSYADGRKYPDCAKGKKDAKHVYHVCGEPLPFHHYECVREPERLKLKFDAFEHRRRLMGMPMRQNFYENVVLPWREDWEAVERTALGISTETRYGVTTIQEAEPKHPEIMEGFKWLNI